MSRRLFMERFKCPIGVFLLLKKDDKLYLQLRKNCSFEGMYGAIGGHVDGGETIAAAVIREAKEEVGIEISDKDLHVATICHSNAGGKEYMQFFFTCEKWNGVVENKEPDKCEQIDLYDINNLPQNVVPYLKVAIEKINSGEIFFEDGFDK